MTLRLKCKRGHPFTPDNVFMTSTGHRRCRTCHVAEYTRHGALRSAAAARKYMKHGAPVCTRGHKMTPENTKISTTGARRCRICTRAYQQQRVALDPEKAKEQHRNWYRNNIERVREYNRNRERRLREGAGSNAGV